MSHVQPRRHFAVGICVSNAKNDSSTMLWTVVDSFVNCCLLAGFMLSVKCLGFRQGVIIGGMKSSYGVVTAAGGLFDRDVTILHERAGEQLLSCWFHVKK